MGARLRIVIIGGSLGGLFAGNLLHRAGCAVRIYERVPEELAGRGAGIVTHEELHAALRRSGVTVDGTLGILLPGRRTVSRDGAVIAEIPIRQVSTSWARLYRLLRAALPEGCYVGGRELSALEPGEAAVRARFADGGVEEADLLVAADGLRSTVRARLFPAARPRHAGYVGWRGLLEEDAFSPRAHAALFDWFTFCQPEGEQMLGYPVMGTGEGLGPGRPRYNWVWYRPAPEGAALDDLLTDETGRRHEDGIPPPLIRRVHLRALRQAAGRLLSAGFAEVVERTAQPFFQPIVDLESERLTAGRVALIGDAAFVARPHCGMGVTKAAGDALALAEAVRAHPGDPAGALARYEAERLRFGRFIVDHARRLGSFMRTSFADEREAELAAHYRRPEVVMREFAVPPALPAEAR
jgi:2-polyprenyl-6-methoxyphenol hydroxylase-like FAD-dependent oxidoreductase